MSNDLSRELDSVTHEDSERLSSVENVTSVPIELLQSEKMASFFKNNATNGSSSHDLLDSASKDASTNRSQPNAKCPNCESSGDLLVRSSSHTKMTVFGHSTKLDREILEKLGTLLSNQALKKDDEAEYYHDMNIFDQEWEFPFNRRHFEHEHSIASIEANPLEVQTDMFKKSLIDLQMRLRELSDYFVKVDRERMFFRRKLVAVLQSKVSRLVEISPALKQVVDSFAKPESESQGQRIEALEKQQRESESLFSNLKRRNVKLEEDVKKLRKKLKEKRGQLKKYMFRKNPTREDYSATRATVNSKNQHISQDTSRDLLERDAARPTPSFNSNQRRLKFSSTILSTRHKPKQSLKNRFGHNLTQLQLNRPKKSKKSMLANAEEYYSTGHRDALSRGDLGWAPGNAEKDRQSVLTESGQVEIPEILRNLHSNRKSRMSDFRLQNLPGPNSHSIKRSGLNLMSEEDNASLQKKPGNKLDRMPNNGERSGHKKEQSNPFLSPNLRPSTQYSSQESDEGE